MLANSTSHTNILTHHSLVWSGVMPIFSMLNATRVVIWSALLWFPPKYPGYPFYEAGLSHGHTGSHIWGVKHVGQFVQWPTLFFLSSTDNSNCERPVSSPQAHQPTGPPASWPNSSTESITEEHSSRGGCMFASGLGSLGSIHGREYVQIWTRMVLPLVLGEWMRSSLLRTGQQTCGTCTNVVYINNLLADGRWKKHAGQAAVRKWCDWFQH